MNRSYTEQELERIEWEIEVESTWRKTKAHISEFELIQEVPGAVRMLRSKIQENERVITSLKCEITRQITEVNRSVSDEFTRWFLHQVISIAPTGKLLEKALQNRKRLHFLLKSVRSGTDPPKILTNLNIQEARTYPIVELAARFTQLRQRGRIFVAKCPLHAEDSPSFTVYPQTNSWYCFGCNTGGDTISLLRLASNLSFKEAVSQLTNHYV